MNTTRWHTSLTGDSGGAEEEDVGLSGGVASSVGVALEWVTMAVLFLLHISPQEAPCALHQKTKHTEYSHKHEGTQNHNRAEEYKPESDANAAQGD